MQVTPHCRRLALQTVFRDYGVSPDCGLPYRDLQRGWDGTGLRRSDLDAAISDALAHGELVELHSHEGRLEVLTGPAANGALTLRELEQQRLAAAVLDRTRQRQRNHGLMHGRLRAGDQAG